MVSIIANIKKNKYLGMLVLNWFLWQIFELWLIYPLFLFASALGSILGTDGSSLFNSGLIDTFSQNYSEKFLLHVVGDRVAVGLVLFFLLITVASVVTSYKYFWDRFSNKAWFVLYFLLTHLILLFATLVTGNLVLIVSTSVILLLMITINFTTFQDFSAFTILTLNILTYPLLVGLIGYYAWFFKRRSEAGILNTNTTNIQDSIVLKPAEPAEKKLSNKKMIYFILAIIGVGFLANILVVSIRSLIYQNNARQALIEAQQASSNYEESETAKQGSESLVTTTAPQFFPLPQSNQDVSAKPQYHLKLFGIRQFQVLDDQGKELLYTQTTDTGKPSIQSKVSSLVVLSTSSTDAKLSSWSVTLDSHDNYQIMIDGISATSYLTVGYGSDESDKLLLEVNYANLPIVSTENGYFHLSSQGFSSLTLENGTAIYPTSTFESR